eukprot:5957235-Karenia_brevis.AAC.1
MKNPRRGLPRDSNAPATSADVEASAPSTTKSSTPQSPPRVVEDASDPNAVEDDAFDESRAVDELAKLADAATTEYGDPAASSAEAEELQAASLLEPFPSLEEYRAKWATEREKHTRSVPGAYCHENLVPEPDPNFMQDVPW